MATPRNQTLIIVVSFALLLGIGSAGWIVSFLTVADEPAVHVLEAEPRLTLYGLIVDLNRAVGSLDAAIDRTEKADGVGRLFLSAIAELEAVDPGESPELVRRFDDLLITGFERSRDLVEALQGADGMTAGEFTESVGELVRVLDALRDTIDIDESSRAEAPRTFLEQLSATTIIGFVLVVIGCVVAVVVSVRMHRVLADAARAIPSETPRPGAPQTAASPILSDADPLTGAEGRSAFERMLTGEISRTRRYGHALTVVAFRVDALEDLYEQMGAATGDYVLSTVGEVVSNNIRVSDLFARLGDNLFVLLLPETDARGGAKVAEKLRRNVEIYPFDEISRVTLSLGISDHSKDDEGPAVVTRAETAAKHAAANGGNKIVTA